MKLLLTSAGITNGAIAQAVLDLVDVPQEKIKVAFIPTAANIEVGDKGWLIDNLRHFQEQEYGSVDIVDVAVLTKEQWFPRLTDANLICFGGGNTQYLAKILRTSGLAEVLPELLKTRVYMGISAGSMVAGRFPSKEMLNVVYPDERIEGSIEPALGLTELAFIPHLNSTYFPKVRKDILDTVTPFDNPLYALDDETALKIIDGTPEVVGSGATYTANTKTL